METKEKVRILLVDDEPDIVRLLQTLLSRTGYAVDIGVDAPSAFAAVEKAPQPYNVIVADVTLPGMSGKDMSIQMLSADPNLKVLLCSGYPISAESLPEQLQSRVGALHKPFSPSELVGAIQELLQRKDA